MTRPLEVARTVLVLLAAGGSTRFGAADKLGADLGGRPLGLHVADALAGMPFLARVAVRGSSSVDFAGEGFAVLHNSDPARGMASSLRLGVAWSRERGADAVLVVLADMPLVTAAHVGGLIAASAGFGSVVASSDGRAAKPPALFGRERFAALLALEGDGARAMIRAGVQVPAPGGTLVDVDTPADLARVRETVSG